MARIVIIEQDAALRRDMTRHLRELGHETIVAKDGRKALSTLADAEADIVIADVAAPYEEELVEGIGADAALHAEADVILLSGPDAREAIVEGLRHGADDFVVKPIDYDILQAKIEAFLRHRADMFSAATLMSASRALLDATLAAAGFAGVATALGLAGVLFLYILKTALGIDLFKDMHLSDVLRAEIAPLLLLCRLRLGFGKAETLSP